MRLLNKNELFLLEEVVRRNFSSKYKDSVLGIFWSILRPFLMMLVFTIIFSTLFSKDIANFPVYFLSARCIFDFFNGAVGVSMNSILGNKGILRRTAAPKHIFVLGSIISEFLNFLISLILLAIIMVATNAPFYFMIMPVAIMPILSILILVTGLGFLLSILATYYTDVKHLWGVLSILLMYGSALFYPMDIIPEPYHQYMILNPLYWTVDQFRSVIYAGVIPDFLYMLNLFLISLIILVVGLIVYEKYIDNIAMRF